MRHWPLFLILLGLVGVAVLVGGELGVFDAAGNTNGGADDFDLDGDLTGSEGDLEEDAAGVPGLKGNPNARAGDGSLDPSKGPDGADGEGAATVLIAGGVPFKGQVLGPDKRPVAEAQITLARAGTVLTFTTDEDGRFTHGPQPGRWDLSVIAPGVGSLLRRSMMIDGANAADLTFNLRKPGTLTIVMQRGKEGVEGIELSMIAQGFTDAGGAKFDATTNAEGRAVFENVPGANYEITAEVPDGPALRQSIGIWSNRTLRIPIPRGVALTGKVTEGKDGPGIANAIVIVDVAPHKSNGRSWRRSSRRSRTARSTASCRWGGCEACASRPTGSPPGRTRKTGGSDATRCDRWVSSPRAGLRRRAFTCAPARACAARSRTKPATACRATCASSGAAAAGPAT